MDKEDLAFILPVMTTDQIKKLLLTLQSTQRKMVLRYLLNRAGQWTNLMQEMMNKATEDWLKAKLRRLITIVDSRFGQQDVYSLINSDDQNDEQFT